MVGGRRVESEATEDVGVALGLRFAGDCPQVVDKQASREASFMDTTHM